MPREISQSSFFPRFDSVWLLVNKYIFVIENKTIYLQNNIIIIKQ